MLAQEPSALHKVTPVVLTYNEAPNIRRTLENISWARRIVLVDSNSQDDTLAIAGEYPAVHVFQRAFDCHANQWNFAISETGIDTPWVLALDADYQVSSALREEIRRAVCSGQYSAFRARFDYCVFGRKLRATAYPPVTVLFRRDGARYVQDGHTQRLETSGPVGELTEPIQHDDRKPLGDWIKAQSKYAGLEADKLLASRWTQLGAADRLRRGVLFAPPAMLLYCLFVKGNVLDGLPGLYYALQRAAAELMLSLHLLERRLRRVASSS